MSRGRVYSPWCSGGFPDTKKKWLFNQETSLKVGDPVSGGDILGFVEENGLMKKHYIMCPPNVSGRIVKLYGRDTDGNEMFTVRDTVAEVEDDVRGVTHQLKLSHFWPVRKPRPVAEKLAGCQPLITGQRVIDGLFPSVLGGTCAVPGAFGCGKTVISQHCRNMPIRMASYMLGAENEEMRWLRS